MTLPMRSDMVRRASAFSSTPGFLFRDHPVRRLRALFWRLSFVRSLLVFGVGRYRSSDRVFNDAFGYSLMHQGTCSAIPIQNLDGERAGDAHNAQKCITRISSATRTGNLGFIFKHSTISFVILAHRQAQLGDSTGKHLADHPH